MKLLVTFNGSWADEIEFEGYVIFEKDEWEETKKKLENWDKEIHYYYGSNEEGEWENGKKLLTNYEVREIPDEDANVLIKVLGETFGEVGPILDFDEEYEYEDD